MVGDHIYLNIGGIFSLKPFNLTGIAGGLLFISHSFDESLLKQYKSKAALLMQNGLFVYFSSRKLSTALLKILGFLEDIK